MVVVVVAVCCCILFFLDITGCALKLLLEHGARSGQKESVGGYTDAMTAAFCFHLKALEQLHKFGTPHVKHSNIPVCFFLLFLSSLSVNCKRRASTPHHTWEHENPKQRCVCVCIGCVVLHCIVLYCIGLMWIKLAIHASMHASIHPSILKHIVHNLNEQVSSSFVPQPAWYCPRYGIATPTTKTHWLL